jgi:hypothetical protein
MFAFATALIGRACHRAIRRLSRLPDCDRLPQAWAVRAVTQTRGSNVSRQMNVSESIPQPDAATSASRHTAALAWPHAAVSA